MARILIMDDSKTALEIAADILRSHQHEVITATNGLSAVQAYVRNKLTSPIDLCVFDLQCVRGMGGVEALRMIRANDPKVKAIAFSDDKQELDSTLGKHGFVGYVSKADKDKDALAKTVAKVLQYSV